jgi:hypothetical protein
LLGPPICDQLVGKVLIRREVGDAPTGKLDGGQSFLQVWIGSFSRIRHGRSLLTAPA